MEIIGQDRPGIVREISAALARAGVNVEEFSSEVASGPMSGETIFKGLIYKTTLTDFEAQNQEFAQSNSSPVG